MQHKHNSKRKILHEAFDTLFIMILCFGTLLTAMLMKGKVVEGMTYTINIKTFTMIVLVLGIYLSYLLSHSDKGLKAIINQMYGDKEV